VQKHGILHLQTSNQSPTSRQLSAIPFLLFGFDSCPDDFTRSVAAQAAMPWSVAGL
jgi:hypothetical protein